MKEINKSIEANSNELKSLNEKASEGQQELNSPLESVDNSNIPQMDSLDCRSECKYNTGSGSKYANYGFSG